MGDFPNPGKSNQRLVSLLSRKKVVWSLIDASILHTIFSTGVAVQPRQGKSHDLRHPILTPSHMLLSQ